MKRMKTLCGKISDRIRSLLLSIWVQMHAMMCNSYGDLAVSTIGGIIVGVVLVGLLIVAIKAFFPGFFNTMFTSMQTKLNANW